MNPIIIILIIIIFVALSIAIRQCLMYNHYLNVIMWSKKYKIKHPEYDKAKAYIEKRGGKS